MPGKLPFAITKTDTFFDKMNEWIGDVFYDILPEAGFELRDEQVYMAFQLEKAFKEKKVIFAEAGVGTGKTIVYLLYAICYARYLNKPAIIACADETLIEQLVKREGDIAKLEKALDLKVDVRLAKSRDQYLCLNKLDTLVARDEDDAYNAIFDSLPGFIHSGSSMQAFQRYGDRKDYPDLTDNQWERVSWDSLQDCFTCEKRHRCAQTLHRDYYRSAADLIVCSHDFYMEHIWTMESRKREGQTPFLPESSCVVFDEGHLLEFASQKALTYRYAEKTLETLLTRLMENDVRETTLNIMETALEQNELFFENLSEKSVTDSGSEKRTVLKDDKLRKIAETLHSTLESLEEELVFESELFVIDDYSLKIVEEYLEQIVFSLSLFKGTTNGITWFEAEGGEQTLVIMPKMVEEILRTDVFSQKKPFIFSSATLSERNSFDYLASSLGIDKYSSFSVESPFDYDTNMKVYMPEFEKNNAEAKAMYVIDQIKATEGRALILFRNQQDLLHFKEFSAGLIDYPVFYEGEAEISSLVSRFQNDEHSVLCSVHLWEGLDIPGSSLENVIIHSLPYPPNDPVFSAKREGTPNAFQEVDMPYMLLRLRQGIGRLIRTQSDHGSVHILLDQDVKPEILNEVRNVLPGNNK
ncbi:ATP-dependent DNA helicase [Mesobacillus harenae]|uniref:ATP-dependent DNA helicase n=1 Tax=Mesobacillus harenae TaxID=2213203 RepID=UPI0015809810|nr:ATP-dependent DNA helicase [Mesobacillus harenae]